MHADQGSGADAVLTRPTPWSGKRSTRIGFAAAVAGFAGVQAFSAWRGLPGPVDGLAADILGRGTIGATPWAALGLAMIGLSGRARLRTLAATGGLAFSLALALLGTGHSAAAIPRHLGAVPLLMLPALTVLVIARWTGRERDSALRGLALAGLLVAAAKIGDLWLIISVQAGPQVFDEYAMLADQALGQPSWRLAQLLETLGPAASFVLHQVYSGLPVAAMVVTVWQLRAVGTQGWPGHHLVRTFLVLGVTGPLIYLVFPVVGPMFAFGAAGHGLQISDSWPLIMPTLTDMPAPLDFDQHTPRNCMPSMHTAWALAVFLHSRRGPAWLRWGGTFWLVATMCATLGFGYHYGVDLVAGIVLCLTVESALRAPELGWNRYRVRLVAAGVSVLAALLLSYRFAARELAELPVLGAVWILGALGTAVLVFYACWFASPATALGRWGGWWLGRPRTAGTVNGGAVSALRPAGSLRGTARSASGADAAPALAEAAPSHASRISP